MKKIILFFCGCLLFMGCKSKKTTIHSGDLNRNTVVLPKKESPKKAHKSLPKDTGRFVSFSIESAEDYIETFSEVAQLEMYVYGIPASITLAQGLLESGFGKGALAKKTNNHFGIKCHTGWEGDYAFHDDDEKGECFRKYNHPMSSFRDHSIFLSTRSRYAFLFNYSKTDYKKWAYGLRKSGYATDKRYPQKLIYLIEKHQLYTYDTEISEVGYRKNPVVATETNAVHIVKKGETLYALARKYYISVDQLMQMNNLKSSNLSIGQKLRIKTSDINK